MWNTPNNVIRWYGNNLIFCAGVFLTSCLKLVIYVLMGLERKKWIRKTSQKKIKQELDWPAKISGSSQWASIQTIELKNKVRRRAHGLEQVGMGITKHAVLGDDRHNCHENAINFIVIRFNSAKPKITLLFLFFFYITKPYAGNQN